MNDFTTILQDVLSEGADLSSLMKEMVRSEVERIINCLLENELTAFLNYEKWSIEGYHSGDSRNGYYLRQFKTQYGNLNLKVPRDRNGEFHQKTIPPYKRNEGFLEQLVIELYQKGSTTLEISEIIERLYGHHYCRATTSNLCKLNSEAINNFQQRQLNKRYCVIYGDATYINIRRDSVAKEALHVLIGINEEGYKEILALRLFPSETSENYKELLLDIKARGVEEVLLFISDGLNGLAQTFLQEFPKAKYQSCWVHLGRNIMRQVRSRDKAKVMEDVKKIYNSDSKEEAVYKLNEFIDKYQKSYPRVVRILSDNKHLFTFYDFPKEVRKSLYTSNLIEGFNKLLKKDIKRKEQFPNEESAMNFIVTKAIECSKRYGSKIHKGFKEVRYELEEMFNSL